jgi:hypothetical protein
MMYVDGSGITCVCGILIPFYDLTRHESMSTRRTYKLKLMMIEDLFIFI